jgi:DNA-binding MarR family transcriptional regulator
MRRALRALMAELTCEDLFKRLLACAHESEKALRRVERFEEWAATEVFALRAFQRAPNCAQGAAGLARDLHCSVPYASTLMKRLRSKGLVEDGTAWRTYRSMVLTEEGRARLEVDAGALDSFAQQLFDGFSDENQRHLAGLLGRVYANVRMQS